MNTFNVLVSYSQIAVFEAGLKDPFNDWNDAFILQGFSWRPRSVSFRTLEESGLMVVTVERGEEFPKVFSDTYIWVIEVPFEVQKDGIEIATIADSKSVKLKRGKYRLLFEHGRDGEGKMFSSFKFFPVAVSSSPHVYRGDMREGPNGFLMNANPAI